MSEPPADRLTGNIHYAKGLVENTIGQLTGSEEWKEAGQAEMDVGNESIRKAKEAAYAQATGDKIGGSIQSGFAMLTGDQKSLNEGNQAVQKAEFKQAANAPAGPLSYLPNSAEDAKQRVAGKLESAQGMVTGDLSKQMHGNTQDAKADLHDSVDKFISGSNKST